MPLRIRKQNLLGLPAILLALTVSHPAKAALSNGTKPTNAIASEEQRILLFHEAEESFQEKLRVGKERYNQKQEKRAKVIAAMSAELQAREQKVVMPSATTPQDEEEQPDEGSWLFPIGSALLLALFGMVYRQNRLRTEAAAKPNPKAVFFPVALPHPDPAAISLADTTFFCKESGAEGRGRATEHGFMVLKGSIARNPSNADPSTSAFLAKMFDLGVIRQKGHKVIFMKDHEFATPSLAANALLCRKTNGLLEWKTEDGMTLDTVQRLQPKVKQARNQGGKRPASIYKPARAVAG